ncbi:hypothetical protein BH09PLA1_BH09PLA1_05450 [soil metagenome]
MHASDSMENKLSTKRGTAGQILKQSILHITGIPFLRAATPQARRAAGSMQ